MPEPPLPFPSQVQTKRQQFYPHAVNKTSVAITGLTAVIVTYTVDGQLSDETALIGTPTVTSAANGQTAGSFNITVDMTGVTGHTVNYEAAAPAFVNGTLTVSNFSGGRGDLTVSSSVAAITFDADTLAAISGAASGDLSARDITSGTTGTTFSPDATLTRGH